MSGRLIEQAQHLNHRILLRFDEVFKRAKTRLSMSRDGHLETNGEENCIILKETNMGSATKFSIEGMKLRLVNSGPGHEARV